MPILELLIHQLGKQGITGATLAVGYLAPLIMAYFGDGERFGMPIEYSIEQEPLGTAGPLGRVSGLNEAFLAMNGDLLTDLDFQDMVQFHRRNSATATVGIYKRQERIDLGVIQMDGSNRVTG
jgi:NDP-sugar pyrophosphorylase family protein